MGGRQHLPLLLRDALDDKGWSYQIDEGGGAFYGPKIDLKIEDALGRRWQCSTIQVDFPLWLSPIQAHVLPVTDSQDPQHTCTTVTWAMTPDSPPSDSTPLSTPSPSRTPPPIPQSSTAPP
ncbi:hypothetical protein ACFX15_019385 [Malus domestica]|uniref:Uncharacterized protein n=1 Tax=Malus domestica TaxID=3750 RepID=A0A498HSJ0_MALDO|nr:hypothetical protein DVH24_016571 [Malus domestica]